MTREEHIKQVAECWLHDKYGVYDDEDEVGESMKEDFIDGVKWAEEHPGWHKYPEDKPEFDNDYIVWLEGPDVCPSMDIYEYSEKTEEFGFNTIEGLGPVKWISIDSCVTAWMEKPQPPKFN